MLLDAGALIAYAAVRPGVEALLAGEHDGETPVKTAAVLLLKCGGEEARPARLAGSLLRGVAELPLDPDASRRIGVLLQVCVAWPTWSTHH
ncbi:MAG: hypothetical protein IPH29_16145 [Candidatus Microthrix sp.]|nr:hypothetical protein [Candidatus Microthrix sp.]